MKRVLVTGATGGLGRNAVPALLARGVAVRATGRNAAVGQALAALGAEFVALDLRRATPAQWAQLVRDVDAVWHCAALSAPWGRLADFTAINVDATRSLLDAAGHAGVARFVHISTPAVYFDNTHRYDVAENFQAARPVNAYAATKAEAERCVRHAARRFDGMTAVILRPRALFGPFDQVLLPRLSRVIAANHGRLPLPRGGRTVLDLTYVENVVQAMWRASVAEGIVSGTAFNVTNHAPVMLRDVLHALYGAHLGRALHIVALPVPLMAVAARALEGFARLTGREPVLTAYSVGVLSYDMTLDNTRARQVLGYVPEISVDEGVRRTAEWMRQQERNG